MDILIVHPKLTWRGAEKLSVNLASALQSHGHNVAYLTLFVESKGIPTGIKKVNLIVPSLYIQKILRFNDLFFMLFGFWVLLFLVFKNAKKFQIINVHNIPSTWVGAIVGRIYHKPVVWTVHDVPKDISWKHKSSIIEYVLWFVASSFIDKLLVKRIDVVITQCKNVANEVKTRYKKETRIILPAVDSIYLKKIIGKRFFSNTISGKFVFLSASHMHFRKNQKTIIKAFSKFSKKVINSSLLLAGDGPDKPKLATLVNDLSLEHKVFFTGILSENRLAKLYESSNVLLLASIEEPWGLTPFEALAMGTPVIVSKFAGAYETIRGKGLGYFSKPSINSFYATMLDVYLHYEKAKKVALRGKRWVRKNMMPDRYAGEYELIYKSLIG